MTTKTKLIKKCVSYGFSATLMIALTAVFMFTSTLPNKNAAADTYQEYAVIYPPGTEFTTALKSINRAQARLVRNTGVNFMFVVASKSSTFQNDIKSQGAWLSFSPLIKGACNIENNAAFKKEA